MKLWPFGFHCSWPRELALLLMTAALFWAMQGILGPQAPGWSGVFRLQLAPTPEALAQAKALWGADGVARYRRSLGLDTLYAAAYAATLSCAAALLCRRPKGCGPRGRRFLIALPWLAALGDGLENGLHAWLLPLAQPPGWAVALAALAAGLKWALLLGVTFPALAVLGLRRLLQR